MTPIPYAEWIEPPGDVYYALSDDESSSSTIEEVVEQRLYIFAEVGDTDEQVLERLTWPLLVEACRPATKSEQAIRELAEGALSHLIDYLDDVDGADERTEIEPVWREAMRVAVRTIVETYPARDSERVALIAVSREDAQGMIDKEAKP